MPWAAAEGDAPEAAALAELVRQVPTRALLASRRDRILVERYGDGSGADDLLQGGSLTRATLAPLYAVAGREGIDLLDAPLRGMLPDLGDDPRGDITPRQLLWEVSGLEALPWRPLDPFNARARLTAGPSFERAARAYRLVWPPGSHFETSAANAQLAAIALATARGRPLAQLLEEGLWRPAGAGRARVALDRLGGTMAAHCCLAAAPRDWLRLAALYASDGMSGRTRLWPEGFVMREVAGATAVHPAYGLGVEIETLGDGTVVLWAGSGDCVMLAVPANGLAAVWFTREPVDAAQRALLKAALGLERSGDDS
jgi:CubicO group peptidase (beta-lactamase class C family)